MGGDHFPTEFLTADQAWRRLEIGIVDIRSELGEERADQIREMLAVARAHYEAGEHHLGSWLMQDIEQVTRGTAPYAYPAESYPWPRHAGTFAKARAQ